MGAHWLVQAKGRGTVEINEKPVKMYPDLSGLTCLKIPAVRTGRRDGASVSTMVSDLEVLTFIKTQITYHSAANLPRMCWRSRPTKPAAAEPARPIKGLDERLTQRAQLNSPIQSLTYAAAVLGCSRSEGRADGGRPGKVASTSMSVCLSVSVRHSQGLILRTSV